VLQPRLLGAALLLLLLQILPEVGIQDAPGDGRGGGSGVVPPPPPPGGGCSSISLLGSGGGGGRLASEATPPPERAERWCFSLMQRRTVAYFLVLAAHCSATITD
jgi:hypothetical protein